MVPAVCELGRKALSLRSRSRVLLRLSEKNETSIINGNTADKRLTKANATQRRDFQKLWKTSRRTGQKC